MATETCRVILKVGLGKIGFGLARPRPGTRLEESAGARSVRGGPDRGVVLRCLALHTVGRRGDLAVPLDEVRQAVPLPVAQLAERRALEQLVLVPSKAPLVRQSVPTHARLKSRAAVRGGVATRRRRDRHGPSPV